MRLAVLILATFVAFSATGQSGKGATLNWVLPTEYTNGTPIAAGDLAEIRIYRNGALAASVAGSATSAVLSDLPYGSHSFHVTAVAKNGVESDVSNTATKDVVDDRKPRAPTLLDVLIAWIRSIFARFA